MISRRMRGADTCIVSAALRYDSNYTIEKPSFDVKAKYCEIHVGTQMLDFYLLHGYKRFEVMSDKYQHM